MRDLLNDFYSPDGPERCGFILDDGSVVEVDNVASDPNLGFDIEVEDLLTFEHRAVASWHTHPGSDSNLSEADASGFLNWPSLQHYIIGSDGIRCYHVEHGRILNA